MKEEIALKISNVSKQYRLGLTGTGTISDDLTRWWAKVRGKEDPFLKVGVTNNRAEEGGDYVWALKDINIEVKKGEILGIIGKNGAGKSTLLKLLSKITGPTTGSIKVNGRMASLLEVGTGFHPELTGKENVYLNGAILGMTKREIASKMDEIVEFSGCAKYIDTPVKRYSSGMRVRLGFAVAAFLDPDILVVDEVLAVGDAEFQKKAIGKMKDVSSEGGRTVLFVSHNMESIKALCERAIVLDKGKVVFDSTDVEKAVEFYYSNDDFSLNRFHKENQVSDIKSIVIDDCNVLKGNAQGVFVGGDMVIEMKYHIIDETYFGKNISVAISVKDLVNSQRTLLSNVLMDTVITLKENGVIRCKIKKVPFQAGEYKINIMIRSGSLNLLWIQDAYLFKVYEGDFYDVGISNYSFKIGNFVDQEWVDVK